VVKAANIAVMIAIVVLMTCCDGDNTRLYVDILAQEDSEDYEVFPKKAGKGLSVLFVGDTSFGESYHKKSFFESKGYDHFLEKVDPLIQRSDLVIANLETPLTDLPKSPLFWKKKYTHWGDPRKAPTALKNHNIGFVSLANNHTMDYDVEGLLQTLQVLKESGIVSFGAGLNASQALKPLRRHLMLGDRSFHLVVASGFEYKRLYNYIYRFYAKEDRGGVNRWTRKDAAQQIRAIRQADRHAFIVAFPHWGRNYRFKTRGQTKLAHTLIEAGSDLVIGHGAHILQEIEFYRDKWILYSLGNFVFNSPGRYQKEHVDPFSLAVSLDAVDRDGQLSLILRIYPVFSDNRLTGYQPRLVTREELDRVRSILLQRSPDPVYLQKQLKAGKDEVGFFLALGITPPQVTDLWKRQ